MQKDGTVDTSEAPITGQGLVDKLEPYCDRIQQDLIGQLRTCNPADSDALQTVREAMDAVDFVLDDVK